MTENKKKFGARNILLQTGEGSEIITQDLSNMESTRYGSKVNDEVASRKNVDRDSDGLGGTHVSPEDMDKRKKEANLKKIKDAIANKEIYEFTDDEKVLYIEFHSEFFSYTEEDLGDCEFITSSPIAELVLSDFFIKKEER